MDAMFSVLASVAVSALIQWGAFRYFQGRFEEWKLAASKADEGHGKNIDGNTRDIASISGKLEAQNERISRAQMDIRELRDYKHEKIIPYIGAMDAMNARVQRVEIFLNGRMKDGK